MKAKYLFPCAILANLAQFLLCFLYSGGGPLILVLTVPVQVSLFLLSRKAANTWPRVILLGALHLAVTISAYWIYGQLYLLKIHYDFVGEAILLGIMLIAAGLVAILWFIHIVFFAYRRRKRKIADL